MFKSFIIISTVIFFSFTSKGAGKIFVPSSIHDENDVLNHIVNEYIPTPFIESPDDLERLKRLLKRWNPHIKDWRDLSSFDVVNIYKKKWIGDASFGLHKFQNEEELKTGEILSNETVGSSLDFKLGFFHKHGVLSHLKLRFVKKQEYMEPETEETYSFPVDYLFEYGLKLVPSSARRWQLGASLSYEQYSFLSFDGESSNSTDEALGNLELAFYKSIWVDFLVGMRFSAFGKGTYLNLGFGSVLSGTKEFDLRTDSFDITGNKVFVELKHFVYQKYWLKIYGQYREISADLNSSQAQIGFYIGRTIY